jgi:hypothetical protein
MHNLNPTVRDRLPVSRRAHYAWRSDPWLSDSAEIGHDASLHRGMEDLATKLRLMPAQTGYGGTTPGSVPVSPDEAYAPPVLRGFEAPIAYGRPLGPPIDYAGGGGGVTANDILGQFGPVVTTPQVDPLMQLLRAFLSQRR